MRAGIVVREVLLSSIERLTLGESLLRCDGRHLEALVLLVLGLELVLVLELWGHLQGWGHLQLRVLVLVLGLVLDLRLNLPERAVGRHIFLHWRLNRGPQALVAQLVLVLLLELELKLRMGLRVLVMLREEGRLGVAGHGAKLGGVVALAPLLGLTLVPAAAVPRARLVTPAGSAAFVLA